MTTLTPSGPPIEEVLLSLADAGWKGSVSASGPRHTRRLFIDGGELVGVSSENPLEWLGHFLVGSSLLSEEQLHAALAGQEQDAVPLGVIVERAGLIDQQALQQALAAQAVEVVCSLFQTAALAVRTSEGELPRRHPLGLRLKLPQLVLEGIRRRIRLREIDECLGGIDVIPRRVTPYEPPSLSPTERRILAAVDGASDMEAIGLACHLAAFRVAEFVIRGVEAGFLAVAPPPVEAEPASDREVIERAVTALERGELKEAWDWARPLTGRPTDRETFDQVEAIRRRIEEALARSQITGHLIPTCVPAAGSAAAAPLEPEVAYVLSRVNGTWNLRQIQQIVPLEELHFSVIIDTLLRRRLIELRRPDQRPADAAASATRSS